MNSDNNSYENGNSSHVHDVFLDKQLQNKLLQADEDLDIEAYESKLSKAGNNVKNGATKVLKTDCTVEDITGWFPNSKFVARQNLGAKTDNQTAKSTKDTFIHPWKDYRAKKEESFVFKHYNEPKKYIEQYRNEHGCHNTRFSSGNQFGEMRRIAFQTTAPQSQAQNAVQVSLQQIQQVTSNGSSYQSGLHYTNRKEQLGTLQVNQGPSSVCTCKTGHADPANNNHRYKLSQPVGHMSRTNTDIRSYPSELSDNSSDTGDQIRSNSPVRRINSATSSRSNSRHSKSPTKITVPANPRAYPLHALTIQQNSKPEVQSPSKPLDNLNCVAPEKQPINMEKKPVEPLGVALRVQSLHDLLTNNETPLRGSALPKSMPPNPVSNNKLLRQDPQLDGLTWAEKLEILRRVNKRPFKPKPKQPKLRYVSDSQDDRLWSPEEEQIYEQRRIKHLLEQARVKGGKQYDWVHEAHMRARGIDWVTGKLKLQSGDSGDSNSDINEFHGSTGKLEKYGIGAYGKLSSASLFDQYNSRRSKTFILP